MSQENFTTEQRNTKTLHIDQATTEEIVMLMNEQDATVAEAVKQELPVIAQAVDRIVERLRLGGRLIYMGAGTSGRLGVLDASECPPTFGCDPQQVQGIIAGGYQALYSASEGAEDSREAGIDAVHACQLQTKDVLVGISASGCAAYVLAGLIEARARGALTIALTNHHQSPIIEHADLAIVPCVGPEVITGSTRLKAGTSQKMVLNMLSTASMIRLGKVYQNYMVDLKASNQKLRRRAMVMLQEITGVSEEEARSVLQEAHWQVKCAVVMICAEVSCLQAQTLLQKSEGRVHRALQLAPERL